MQCLCLAQKIFHSHFPYFKAIILLLLLFLLFLLPLLLLLLLHFSSSSSSFFPLLQCSLSLRENGINDLFRAVPSSALCSAMILHLPFSTGKCSLIKPVNIVKMEFFVKEVDFSHCYSSDRWIYECGWCHLMGLHRVIITDLWMSIILRVVRGVWKNLRLTHE